MFPDITKFAKLIIAIPFTTHGYNVALVVQKELKTR